MKFSRIVASLILFISATGGNATIPYEYQPAMDLTAIPWLDTINNKVLSLAPAPALSLLHVSTLVSSSQPEGEIINPGQRTTTLHHEGNVFVYTIEIGYGTHAIVYMNNKELPFSALQSIQQLCVDAQGHLHFCQTGESIVGFMRVWNVSGYGNGIFSYSLTSINYPWNTLNTQLLIN